MLLDEIKQVDDLLDQGLATDEDRLKRSHARSNLYSLDTKDIKDLAQKAKIKWSIQGDENSRYFHRIINSKRIYLIIRGIKREGTWVSDPIPVKEVFLNHFRGKFSRMENVTVSQRSTRFKSLSEEQSIMLTGSISMHELKDAVWSCGNDKAPGPDGFTFSLVKRLSSDGKKMSKLDRFFISEGVSAVCPYLSANVLNNVVSDHRPIILKQEAMDYGLRVFLFFNSWLDEKDFEHVVVSSWNGDDQMVDDLLDQGLATDEDRLKRSHARSNLYSLDTKDIKDLAQKAKIKWSIQGDENSRYFHRIINSKRIYLTIRGIKREGTWVSDPIPVKEVFLNHFRGKFSRMENVTVSQRSTRFKSLSEEQSIMLTGPISMHELKDVVWSCGNDKAPGPDGFTFSLVKMYWEILKTDILEFVSKFFVTGFILTGCNSSFITLIPKAINPMGVSDYRPISLIAMEGLHVAMKDAIASNFFQGLKIGNDELTWEGLVNRFHKRLSKWKVSTLSIGGRAVLIKMVLGCTIVERWNNGFWDWKWRQNIRGGIEQCQFIDLMLRLSDFSCSDVPDRWWWDIDTQGLFVGMPEKKKKVIEAVCLTTIWVLWKFINAFIFKSKELRKECIVDSIKELAFLWICNRRKKCVHG
uniref:RNA-directed DNA polymerase, eukaryota n=1 Tax=Tanacetum cinerariifolium TaxID=118510 RepID=A0A699IQW6_TANCI|nr:RNA-directed DNA polymerase, eukaryota [Tanacetum cinerariifolium]